MYDFHYNVMKSVFGARLRLLYMDTDSLLYEIEDCADPYLEIFAAGHDSHFDLSNFPPTIGCMMCHVNVFWVLSKTSVGGPHSFLNLWACVVKCTVCSLTMVPHNTHWVESGERCQKLRHSDQSPLSMITFCVAARWGDGAFVQDDKECGTRCTHVQAE